MDCIFCRIAQKKLKANILYEDDIAMAFEDTAPQAPVHVLIIPKKHIPTALDLAGDDSSLIGHLYQIANRIAQEKGISSRGFRVVMNCNSEAGQSVFHLHLHLMGGRHMRWPPG